MKNILILIAIVFISGCASYAIHPFGNIENSCNRFYDNNNRWPSSEKELTDFDKINSKEKTEWGSISDLTIKKISEDEVKITFSVQRCYGKDTVSGSVYRPIIKVNINKSDN